MTLWAAFSTVVADVLGVPEVLGSDNFFALGGDSLLAMELVISLSAIVGWEVPISYIFESEDFGTIFQAVVEHPDPGRELG